MDKDIALLDAFADHYITCPQCRLAFEELRDTDYCETGMPLFQAWKNEPLIKQRCTCGHLLSWHPNGYCTVFRCECMEKTNGK